MDSDYSEKVRVDIAAKQHLFVIAVFRVFEDLHAFPERVSLGANHTGTNVNSRRFKQV